MFAEYRRRLRTKEKFQILMDIVNAICKRFFEFSKFTVEEKKKERCNLSDFKGWKVSYDLSKSLEAKSVPIFFQQGLVQGEGLLCVISDHLFDHLFFMCCI